MNWFSNPCRRPRRSLCLLASGVLPEAERAALASHLAGCEDCRRYYDEIAKVTTPLAAWESRYSHFEPSEDMRMRWTRSIQAVAMPQRSRRCAPQLVLLKCWRELVWPCRRAWAGLVAAWLVLLVVNTWLTTAPKPMMAAATGAVANRIQLFEEQRRVLVELTGPVEPAPAGRAQHSRPQPRSERAIRIRIA